MDGFVEDYARVGDNGSSDGKGPVEGEGVLLV